MWWLSAFLILSTVYSQLFHFKNWISWCFGLLNISRSFHSVALSYICRFLPSCAEFLVFCGHICPVLPLLSSLIICSLLALLFVFLQCYQKSPYLFQYLNFFLYTFLCYFHSFRFYIYILDPFRVHFCTAPCIFLQCIFWHFYWEQGGYTYMDSFLLSFPCLGLSFCFIATVVSADTMLFGVL